MKKITKIMVIFTLALFMLFHVNVKAEEKSYAAGDIERIYITSEQNINSLSKNSYVAAEVAVVLKDGTVQLSDLNAQVKLRGNSTSKAEKKPLKIKLSSKQSLLGMDKGKKWNLLANAFDKTLIRNKLCLDLGEKMGLAYLSQSRFVDVYYNDELMGNYLITEPVEAGTGKVEIEENGSDFMIELERERYESDVTYVQTKNGLRFAINVPETPTQAQVSNIETYLKNVETSLKTYKMSEYSKYIDVDSFVNYYIVSEIFKAVDFNYSSTRFYVKDGRMYAGPLWDYDLSSGNASPVFYSGYYNGGVSYKDLYCTQMKWFGYLIKSDEFVTKVNSRLSKMYSTIENMYKTNALGTNQIDLLMNTYGNSFERNYASKSSAGAGWSLTKRYSTCDNPKGLEYTEHADTYQGNVEMLRNWLSNRVNYLKSEWKSIKNNKVEDLQAEKKSYNKIYLSWYNSGVADGNEIYVKEKGKYKLVATINNGDTQEYTVKNLKAGVTYSFAVKSFVRDGNEKIYSDFQYVSKKIKFKSPKAKTKTLSQNKVKITWKKVKGAEGYIVYFGTKKGKLKKAATVKGNKKLTYTKKNVKAKKYYVEVKAYVTYNGKKYMSE